MNTLLCRLLPLAFVIAGIGGSIRGAAAQEPAIQRMESVALQPGQKATVTVHGAQLKSPVRLWTSVADMRPRAGQDPAADKSVVFEGDIPAETKPGIYAARVVTAGGCSEAFFFIIDDLAAVTLAAESEAPTTPQAVAPGSYLEGQMNAVKPRYFRVPVKAGQKVSVEVFARRLSSELDPVLTVQDPSGREVAFSDDVPGLEGDAALAFTASADGDYLIQLRDVRYTGGARHFFHLRIGQFAISTVCQPRVAAAGQSVQLLNSEGECVAPPVTVAESVLRDTLFNIAAPSTEQSGSILVSLMTVEGSALAETEPNDTRESANAVSATHSLIGGMLQEPGDVDWYQFTADAPMPICITAHTRDVRSPADLVLELWGGDGKKLAEADDAAPLDAQLVASLPAAGTYFLKVSELASLGGTEWTYDLEVNRSEGRLELVLPSDRLQVPRGGSASLTATLKRINYSGPVVVEAVKLPGSLAMNTLWLGPQQSTVPLTLTASSAAAEDVLAESGVLQLNAAIPERNPPVPVSITIAPPPPKKKDADPFRSLRIRSDAFVAVSPGAEFSLTAEPAGVVVKRGMSATVTIKVARSKDWTMPIDVGLVTKPDQIPAGVTVAPVKLEMDEGVITIAAAADAALGKFTLFTQGVAKKDKAQATHPVPPVSIEVVE